MPRKHQRGGNLKKSKYSSRKFILLTALFIMAQIFMWQKKIESVWWFTASVVGTFGWAALELHFRHKNKGEQ